MTTQLDPAQVPIQCLWIGDTLSNLEATCLASFIWHGHPLHLYCYQDISNLPSGVALMDANTVLPESDIFYYADRETVSGFANLFRYKLLSEKGGIWVDCDVICLRPFLFQQEHVFPTERPDQVSNFVLKAPANSPVLNAAYQIASEFDRETIRFGQTGPILLNFLASKFDLSRCTMHHDVFCPIPYQSYQELLSSGGMEARSELLESAYGLHLWNEMWRLGGIDKNGTFPESSIYGAMQLKYLDGKNDSI